MPRRKGPPPPLIPQPLSDSKSRNMKKLSLNIPSASSSLPHSHSPPRTRRPSIASLPLPTAASLLYRKEEEEGSPSAPYPDGPIQIIPGIWLGSEDNARDWKHLVKRGIKSILNVAKEVACPLDPLIASQPLRTVASAPNFQKSSFSNDTYYPSNLSTGRPSMHYLKLQWSHGQQDLVDVGFHHAMAFTDAALQRGEGVLIHCQCGISRSATMVIALVMRASAQQSSSVPPDVWALKGYQDAYKYVKEKSKWVGPNMSLIYQLLEYEKKLKGTTVEESSTDEEEEWGRRRRMLDDAPSDVELESTVVMREAEALDKAMEQRIVARKSSASSIASTSSGVGMGAAWRNKYGPTRKRAESVGSNITINSVISEDLVEEDEEQELLGIGGGFDEERRRSISTETEDSSASNSPDDEPDHTTQHLTPIATRPLSIHPPPSAPVWKTSFTIPPPPATAIRSTFDVPPPIPLKAKRRPPPIAILPPVPSSPITPRTSTQSTHQPPIHRSSTLPIRARTESNKPTLPPIHIRNSTSLRSSSFNATQDSSSLATPSQTLFVFPPSPTLKTRTPSTMTLTSNPRVPVTFPSLSTPRVSTFRSHGRTRSFIGLGAGPAPTTAFSKVDARGYVGIE